VQRHVGFFTSSSLSELLDPEGSHASWRPHKPFGAGALLYPPEGLFSRHQPSFSKEWPDGPRPTALSCIPFSLLQSAILFSPFLPPPKIPRSLSLGARSFLPHTSSHALNIPPSRHAPPYFAPVAELTQSGHGRLSYFTFKAPFPYAHDLLPRPSL